MPLVLQAISRIVPLHHYLVIMRSVMLKGAGLAELWPQVLALCGLGLTIGLVALRSVARGVD
jgi:ABC-2 type transport system permease protein